MPELDIEYQKPADLIEYKNNPRNNDVAVDKVAASIEQFGFKVPIIVDAHNIIVAGHTRLRAAKQLGLHQVPTIRADDLTDAQVKAFRLADNKVAEFSDWDWEALELELAEIDDVDMSELGFDEKLPEIDLDGVFEPHEPKEKGNDEGDFLEWSDKKVEISDIDIEILDNKHYEYNSLNVEVSFVQWLADEGM